MFSQNEATTPKFNSSDDTLENSDDIIFSTADLGLRGYEVTAIVFCLIVVVALFMCYLTWNFRYKIVLRTKTNETTVVQNLVALTLQERSNETSTRRSEKVSQHSLYDFERSYRMNSPKTIIEEPQGSTSERKRPSMSRKISESRSEGRIRTNRDCDLQVSSSEGREHHTRIRTRSNSMPHGKTKKKQRAMVLSAVKLSSGQSLPRRVDPSKLCVGGDHPLSSSNKEEEEERKRKPSNLHKITEDQGVAEDHEFEKDKATDVMDTEDSGMGDSSKEILSEVVMN